MTKIIGLDTSSANLAWATPEGHSHIFEASGDATGRRIQLCNYARNFFASQEDGTHIFCEEPLALRNGQTTRVLGLAAGAIWAMHLEFYLVWFWVDVSTWKKYAVGNGNAKKEVIYEKLAKDLRPTVTQDEVDAYGLALYGKHVLGE